MQFGVGDIVGECRRAVAPGVLLEIVGVGQITGLHSAMHLHDRGKGAVLCPAHEEISVIGCEICILVTTNIVAPNRKSAHCSRNAGSDYAL